MIRSYQHRTSRQNKRLLLRKRRRNALDFKPTRYGVMSNPCNIVPEDDLWCIIGSVNWREKGRPQRMDGVLAWCRNETEAGSFARVMSATRGYSNIVALSYRDWQKQNNEFWSGHGTSDTDSEEFAAAVQKIGLSPQFLLL